ncbi:MAG: hypothetical protein OHK0017_02310 [Patescibacteria group bacterium]
MIQLNLEKVQNSDNTTNLEGFQIFFGSVNPGKLKRFKRIADKLGLHVTTPLDLDYEIKVPAEKGVDVLENAEIKARFYWENLKQKMPVISEDVGLNFFGLPEEMNPGKDLKRVVKNTLGSSNSFNMVKYYSDLASNQGGKIECDWEFAYSLFDGQAFYNSELFQQAILNDEPFIDSNTSKNSEHDLDNLIQIKINNSYRPYINLTSIEREIYWERPIQDRIETVLKKYLDRKPSFYPQKILYASGNQRKLEEFRYMVASPKFIVLSLSDIEDRIPPFQDQSDDLALNSKLKAEYYWKNITEKMPVIVQDNQIDLQEVDSEDLITGTLESHLKNKFNRNFSDTEIANFFADLSLKYNRPIEFIKRLHYTIFTGEKSFQCMADSMASLTSDVRLPVENGSPLESVMTVPVQASNIHFKDLDDRHKYYWYSSQREAIQRMLNLVRPGKPKVLFATTNGHKIALFKIAWRKQGLSKYCQMLTLKDIPDLDSGYIQENSGSFGGDALIKAKEYARLSGIPAISQDRGFVFKELNWPGTLTKQVLAGSDERVLGKTAQLVFDLGSSQNPEKQNDWDRTKEALDKLEGLPRETSIVHGLAIALPSGEAEFDEKITEGTAAEKLRPGIGWFFDWFFIPQGYDKTFSQFKAVDLIQFQTEKLYPITNKVINFIKSEITKLE